MIYQVLRCLAWCHKNSPHRLENLWLTDSNILLIWKINMFTQHPFPVDSWLSPNLKPAWLRSREHFQFSWVQSLSHVWLQSHGLQHTRLPCPSPTPRVYSNSSSSSWWCHPTISSSVVPFSCLQSFPSSQSFQMIQFFASGGQSIGVSASTVSPSSEHSGLISFRMDWLDLLTVQGTLKSLFQHHSSKASFLRCSALFIVIFSNWIYGVHVYVNFAFANWTD